MTLSPTYFHRSKDARFHSFKLAGTAVLKWYDLDEDACRITDVTRSAAHAALVADASDLHADIAGFVILHQCSTDFAFLLISTWRGNNELWQAVHYTDAPMTGFSGFQPAYPTLAELRPTFCVWELGIVAHEAQAWQRFLASQRLPGDLATWRADCLTATV